MEKWRLKLLFILLALTTAQAFIAFGLAFGAKNKPTAVAGMFACFVLLILLMAIIAVDTIVDAIRERN